MVEALLAHPSLRHVEIDERVTTMLGITLIHHLVANSKLQTLKLLLFNIMKNEKEELHVQMRCFRDPCAQEYLEMMEVFSHLDNVTTFDWLLKAQEEMEKTELEHLCLGLQEWEKLKKVSIAEIPYSFPLEKLCPRSRLLELKLCLISAFPLAADDNARLQDSIVLLQQQTQLKTLYLECATFDFKRLLEILRTHSRRTHPWRMSRFTLSMIVYPMTYIAQQLLGILRENTMLRKLDLSRCHTTMDTIVAAMPPFTVLQ